MFVFVGNLFVEEVLAQRAALVSTSGATAPFQFGDEQLGDRG
jgi:hypothetical protein